MSEHADQTETNLFDAAKSIVETLKGLDKAAQAMAMRFASETLGMTTLGIPPTAPPPVSPVANVSPTGIGGLSHSTTIKQFCGSKAPKSDQQFAAVVAYFHRFEAPEPERRDTIDSSTLQEATRLVGRSRFREPSKTLRNAKNAGYLDSVGEGVYRINSVGENLVAMTLPGNGADSPVKRAPPKKKKPVSKDKGKKGISKATKGGS